MEQLIKALIVDDDPSARGILQKFLEIGDNVEIHGCVGSANEAMDSIENSEPDVIFLDINMPNEDGIQFVKRLKETGYDIPVVFTSAYRDYAASAFNLKPIDFMVKPFGLDEVFDVLTKIENYIAEKNQLQLIRTKILIPEKIKFRTTTGFLFVTPNDILFIRVERDKTEIFFTNGRKERVIGLLKDLYLEVKKYNFLKINRSVIINLEYIESVERKTNSCVLKYKSKEHSFVMSGSVYNYFENLRSLKLG